MPPEPFSALAEATLGHITLFRDVDSETLLDLGNAARWRRCEAGATLVRRGELKTTFLALAEGTVRLAQPNEHPDETYDAGQTIGLRHALCAQALTFSAVALTPVLIAETARNTLLRAMALSPRLAHNVAQALTGRSAGTDARKIVDARIAAALAAAARPARREGGIARLCPAPDPALWAALLDVRAADVHRALIRFRRRGILVALGADRWCVDLEKLQALDA